MSGSPVLSWSEPSGNTNHYERVEKQKIVSEEIPLSIARLLREKELPSSAKVFLESLNNLNYIIKIYNIQNIFKQL